MLNYTLGTIEASEALIKDLYIDLRAKVNAWSKITQQTPQARMGYVGQHLVSVVTGYPGGKSGARGYDLVIDDERHGEIKTCYRVDQLGSCNACGAVVSSLETECAVCRSTSINRKDDSKWLIAIRNNDEFAKLLDPYRYYFVLFEFESIYDSNNNDIIASIWEVDPKSKGFAYCMRVNPKFCVNAKLRCKIEQKCFKAGAAQAAAAFSTKITALRGDVKGGGVSLRSSRLLTFRLQPVSPACGRQRTPLTVRELRSSPAAFRSTSS